jgi:AcrR family transcriptional regulator
MYSNCMPRPSRNLDRALLAAGRELYAARGCGGLSVREVTEAAGVNLGMFHYHFKSREAYLRALLQAVYEEMYLQLDAAALHDRSAVTALDQLRSGLRSMARFVRANRAMLTRVLSDAACGDAIVIEFVQANFHRHLGMLHALIVAAQAAGQVRPMSPMQALGFCAGSLAMPILAGGAAISGAMVGKRAAAMIEAELLSDAALDERVSLALAALAPATPARKPRRKEKP